MRRLFVLCLLLLLAANAAARSYTASDKPLRPGWWYDPQRAGWAFTLSPAGDELAGTLLTFDSRGEATWYLAIGRGDGRSWTLPVTRHLWDVAANRPGATENVGTFTFTLLAEGRAHARWSIAGETGEADLEPLELAPGYSAEDRSGHWFDPREPGHGYTVYSQGAWLNVVHYGYDAAGQPRWVYADNHGEPARRQMEALYFRRACATCDATVHNAGRMTINLPLEHAGTASLQLALPAPLSGGFQRNTHAIELISDLPSGRAHPAALARFATDTTLRDYLRDAIALTGGASTFCYGIDFSPQPAGARNSSVTNTQEADVDEADLVDSDGEYVYSLFPLTSVAASRLRTHRLRTQAHDLELVSEVSLESRTDQPQPVGLYLVEPVDGPRLVAVVGEDNAACSTRKPTTEVELYGLADRGRPVLRDRLVLEGGLVASRRIGRTLLVVTRHFASVPGLAYGGGSPATLARNREILARTPLDGLVPHASLNGGAPVALVAPATTLLPPLAYNIREDWLLTVTAIPLDDPGAHRSLSVIGQDSAVYVSTGSLYLATTRYAAANAPGFAPPEYFTDVHRIGLAPLRYRASGSVRGYIGDAGEDKPFRFSEHDGRLRVLSDVWAPLSSFGRYELAVLEEDSATRRLLPVGVLPNARRPQPIGKPGETLRAIRYVGPRAYAVTFRQIDPLYAIDLSDPRDPYIAAELEVPGFSSYLHPMPNGVLLGVGLDASATGVTQGVKVASFDAASPAALRVVSQHIAGGSGSWTQLMGDHRAFASLAPSGRPRRIALHAFVRGGPNPLDTTTFDGLLTYDVDPSGLLTPRGEVRAPLSQPVSYDLRLPDGRPYGSSRVRSILADDAVYLYRGGWWFGTRWGATTPMTPPR